MKQEKQQEIALMRYAMIAPLIAGLDADYPSKTAFYLEASEKGALGPDGKIHHYAPAFCVSWQNRFFPRNMLRNLDCKLS